jgi:Flp pilus assembly protein TadD
MVDLESKTSQKLHPAPALLFAGIDLWDNHQAAQALEKFDEVLTLQPKNDLARSYGALCTLALGNAGAAAETWRQSGFSDNTMFRVRTAEFVEMRWLTTKQFMGETTMPSPQPGSWSQRRALKNFYRRDYAQIVRFVAPPPVENEVEAFLAATALEMMRHYSAARKYLDSFLPKRAEWPDPLVALKARLDLRAGHIRHAAREFASVVVMGPEDFGINYYMGIVCLAYEKREEARQYFLRAFTNFMVDTLEFQWWQIEQILLNPEPPADIDDAAPEAHPAQ